MELKDCIENRASCRVFKNQKVEIELLRELIRRGGMAPSVNNSQPWKFIAITSKEKLLEMSLCISNKINQLPSNQSKHSGLVKSQVEWYATFFEDAPALIALTMENYETILEMGVEVSHNEINRLRNFPDLQSAGGAIQTILLSAIDLGLGACWMSAPLIAKNELEKIINITEPWNLISFVAVGYPKNNPTISNKKNLSEIFTIIE